MRYYLGTAVCLLMAAGPAAAQPDRESGTLKLVSVEVRKTKSGGAAWDPGGGAPDLKITVERKARPAGEMFTSKVIPDAHDAKLDVKTLKVKEGDEIEVTVLDQDVGNDDRIGRHKVKVTKAMLRKGQADWSFDDVLSLKVEFVD
jgi:hypothetical protein